MNLLKMKWKIILLSVLGLLVAFSSIALAADPIKLFVTIGEIDEAGGNPGAYLNQFYTWSIGLAAALAMVMIVIGGVQYTLAAGSIGSKDAAKKRITSAIFGLLILLSITLILTAINPNLLNLELGSDDALREASERTEVTSL